MANQYEVKITAQALAQMREINDYIAHELGHITTHHRLHSDKNVTLMYNVVTLKKGAWL